MDVPETPEDQTDDFFHWMIRLMDRERRLHSLIKANGPKNIVDREIDLVWDARQKARERLVKFILAVTTMDSVTH